MDRCCRSLRADRHEPQTQSKQHHPNGTANPGTPAPKKALSEIGETAIRRAIRQEQFEALLPAKITLAEKEWLADQPVTPNPVVVNEPIDHEQQTGASLDLGGPMSIHAPWSRE